MHVTMIDLDLLRITDIDDLNIEIEFDAGQSVIGVDLDLFSIGFQYRDRDRFTLGTLGMKYHPGLDIMIFREH